MTQTLQHSELKSSIKTLALEMGFDQVGITTPAALSAGEQAIEAWVQEGRHGDMRYLEDFEIRRERFFSDFKDAKSVIVLGVNYYSRSQREGAGDKGQVLKGRVARYAWGKDYHKVIRQKHRELIDRLKELAGHKLQAKSCVDIQPIPERFAATQAGLGFVGKHTGILNHKFGPWLFLSEIVTNLELEEDLPSNGDCGTCNHCQKVCPTGALDEDYKMDARLCIAYLTIEHKGVIPRELRPKIKDWIFGCDECLQVCPFTSKTKETRWTEFKPEAGFGEWLDMDELFQITSNSQHDKKFQGTALQRTNRKQLLRNACIVLGNSRKKEALPYLEKALNDPALLVRLHAAWALGQIPFPEAYRVLIRRQAIEENPDVFNEISYSLKSLSP